MREVGCGTVFLRRALGVWGTAPRFLPLSGVGAGGLFFRARRHDAPCRARARQSAGGARLLAPPLREVSDSGRARHEKQGDRARRRGVGRDAEGRARRRLSDFSATAQRPKAYGIKKPPAGMPASGCVLDAACCSTRSNCPAGKNNML